MHHGCASNVTPSGGLVWILTLVDYCNCFLEYRCDRISGTKLTENVPEFIDLTITEAIMFTVGQDIFQTAHGRRSSVQTHVECTLRVKTNAEDFNKICHPSQRPRWQVDKEMFHWLIESPTMSVLPGTHLYSIYGIIGLTRSPEICVNLVFKHIHAASSYTICRQFVPFIYCPL